MKRGLYGVYHHAGDKHLHHYVDEFTFRLNERQRETPYPRPAGQLCRRRRGAGGSLL